MRVFFFFGLSTTFLPENLALIETFIVIDAITVFVIYDFENNRKDLRNIHKITILTHSRRVAIARIL